MDGDVNTELRIQATVGVPVTVTLPSGYSSGAEWRVESSPRTLSVVRKATHRPSSAAIGDAMPVEFELTAASPGMVVVEFALRRPWEDIDRKTQRVVLEVRDHE